MSMQKITIIGNLGGDPVLVTLPSGTKVANAGIAANKKGADGVQKTTWYQLAAYDRLGEILASFGRKGQLVYIEGVLDVREYTGNDGTTRYSLDVVVREFQMLSARPVETASPSASAPASAPLSEAAQRAAETAVLDQTIEKVLENVKEKDAALAS